MVEAKVGLTDKEMKALRPDVPACGQTVFECAACSGGCPIVAKAQLKKVVEWGNEVCVGRENHPGYDNVLRRACSHCWQALLEEVKE